MKLVHSVCLNAEETNFSTKKKKILLLHPFKKKKKRFDVFIFNCFCCLFVFWHISLIDILFYFSSFLELDKHLRTGRWFDITDLNVSTGLVSSVKVSPLFIANGILSIIGRHLSSCVSELMVNYCSCH